MKKLVIAVVVLLLLVLAADRGGAWLAGRVAADALQDSQDLDERPGVTVRGFPFLTQLLDGRFQQVDVEADDVPLGGSDLALDTLDVELRGITREGSEVRARRASAVGVIGYDTVSAALGDSVQLSYAGSGSGSVDVQVRLTSPVALEVRGTVTPQLVDGQLVLGDLRLADQVESGVTQAVEQLVGVRLPLAGIPFSVSLDELAATEDGLRLGLSGEGLRYRIG